MSSSQLSSQFQSTILGFNQDITSGIAPGTLACGLPQARSFATRGQARKKISNKKKSAAVAYRAGEESSGSRGERRGSLLNLGQSLGQHSSKMSIGLLGGGASKKAASPTKYVSEFREVTTSQGFIVREMAPRYLGGHLNPNIESVDEGISADSSDRSYRSKSRLKGQSRQRLALGQGYTPHHGSSSSVQSSKRGGESSHQYARLPQKLSKYQNVLDQKFDQIRDFSAKNLSRQNFFGDIQLLQEQLPPYNRNIVQQGQLFSGGKFVPKKQYRNIQTFSRPEPLKRKEQTAERVNQFANKMKNADQKEKQKMHAIVDHYLKESKEGKQPININGYTNDIQKTNKSFNSPVRMKDPRAAATEVYVAGQWVSHQVVIRGDNKTAVKKEEPKAMHSNVDKVLVGELYTKDENNKTIAPQTTSKLLNAANSKEAKRIFKQQNEALKKQEKEAFKKAKQQLDYFSEKHWGGKKFKHLQAKREQELEMEFIKANKKKPKAEDFFDIGIDNDSDDDFLAQLEKEDKKMLKDSQVTRQQKFLRRLQPAQPYENQNKIDQLFKVHQMEALKELKAQYDQVTLLLDQDDGTMPDKFERIRERQDSQKLYLRYLTLVQHVDDLISTMQAVEQQKSGVETEKKFENSDLKVLLSQTSNMNAIISAGQFNMHRKDVNDRMTSLAFKMEKVYNLDKKKGPASEVYRYFMQTFKSAFQ